MKLRANQQMIVMLLAGVFALISGSLYGQDPNSPLMTGLERPFSQPLFETLSDRIPAAPVVSRTPRRIEQQSYTISSSRVVVGQSATGQICGESGCTDSHVCADSCVRKKPWWERKVHNLDRKYYFNYHRYHPKALYPIVHPACQPGYGYYEACWRRINPNPCFCSPEYGPVLNNVSPSSGEMLTPAPPGETPPPAPAYEQ